MVLVVVRGPGGLTVAEHGADRFRIVILNPRIGNALRVAGNIRLSGLEDVRRDMGTGWAAMVERAMDAAAHVIHRSLTPGDTYSRTDDSDFLICFTGAAEEEARFRAAMNARDIRARLMGDGANVASSPVTALVATIDATGTEEHELLALLHTHLGDRRFVAARQARRLLVNALHTVRCVTVPYHGPGGWACGDRDRHPRHDSARAGGGPHTALRYRGGGL